MLFQILGSHGGFTLASALLKVVPEGAGANHLEGRKHAECFPVACMMAVQYFPHASRTWVARPGLDRFSQHHPQ
jgi:hypothetical protein